jgi:hypothetical protein
LFDFECVVKTEKDRVQTEIEDIIFSILIHSHLYFC